MAQKFYVDSERPNALITGASRGIGRAIAEALAADGYDLILTCRNSIGELESYASSLEEKYGISVCAERVDMSSPSDVRELFEGITDLDVLVNNAGISYIGLLQDMTDEEWNDVIGTNLSSAFYTCRQAIPLMLKKHSGRILNISSVWGNVGASLETAYSASKGGMNAFTRALSKELAPSSIAVNAIACGVIDTDMNSAFSQEDMEALRKEIPADRIGKPEEVAGLASLLLKAPLYMTGQVITLDGGWT
ncbi:MAG: SDR family NAD(P)-dependent oxidoreductase [Lachnospiraceae bacterium]|jgi:3-oxoacyl-[acyl-carrier protein] reductase|nr:SDR family NAD(P)-dependent oxidoreductase [Lachnospiraceae bacterium]